MSAYFISTNLIKVKEAAKELSELYGKTADIYNCGKNQYCNFCCI